VVFINPKFHKQENLPEILAHEKVHICENHWFDLLFIELLTVIFWFNPFIWFFERSIKQNQEYLADKGVLAQGHPIGRYQALLINQLMGMQIIGVTNNLNFALNTNRLKMMTKSKTSRISRIKFLWVLPALALLLFAFAEPVYKVNNIAAENPVSSLQQGEKEIVIKGKVVQEESGKPLHGASVIIEGTTSGTISDENGNFTLVDSNPKKEETGGYFTDVVVSYVGLESRVITVSSDGETLTPDLPDIRMMEGVIYIDLPDYKNVPPPPPPPPTDIKIDNNEEIFIVVEDLPKYPGGIYDLAKYVAESQERLSKQKKFEGKVLVGFTVDEKGKVTSVIIVDQDNDEVGKAATTIVMNMKDWTPGKQRGKPVPVNYLLPITFN
jgi:TonB family protein